MFPADCVRMRGFRKRILDFVVALRWISIISFRSIEVILLQRVDFDLWTLDFVNSGGFRGFCGFRFLDPPQSNLTEILYNMYFDYYYYELQHRFCSKLCRD